MENHNTDKNRYLKSSLLDIIFENRNKDYGAYELRVNYHKRLKRALFISVSLILTTVSVPIIAGLVGGKKSDMSTLKPKEYVISEVRLKKEDPVKPIVPRVKPVKQVQVKTQANHSLKIVQTTPEVKPIETPDPTLPTDATAHDGIKVDPGTVVQPFVEPSEGETVAIAPTKKVEPEPDPEPAIFTEVMPEFPGGEEALMQFLQKHMVYPERARTSGIEGRVVIGFVVNKNGEIDELRIQKGIGFGCDEEAMRVIGSMPKWKPGSTNGKTLPVLFSLPITFELESK